MESNTSPDQSPRSENARSSSHAFYLKTETFNPGMQSKMIRLFMNSAGLLLLAVGAALIISIGADAGFVPPREPLFGISMRTVFWLVGATACSCGLVCLLSGRVWLQINMIMWLALNFLIYQCGLFGTVGSRSFEGYWDALGDTFHIAPSTLSHALTLIFGYLLTGSILLLLWLMIHPFHKHRDFFLKNYCFYCNGKIEFPSDGIGRSIVCPHCKAMLTLCKPPNKMAFDQKPQ